MKLKYRCRSGEYIKEVQVNKLINPAIAPKVRLNRLPMRS